MWKTFSLSIKPAHRQNITLLSNTQTLAEDLVISVTKCRMCMLLASGLKSECGQLH